MQPVCGVISLLTDFGTSDVFVGIVKGVILSRFSDAKIVDLSHEVPAQDVVLAGFWLAHCYRWFPPGTVHLAVVDPGVGTERAVVAAWADGHYFLAPDNGLLHATLEGAKERSVRRVVVEAAGTPASNTFHGRDVFAPWAAALASGRIRFEDLGPPHSPVEGHAVPQPTRAQEGWRAEVLFIDGFGNAITNLSPDSASLSRRATIVVAQRELRIVRTYVDLAPGECGGMVSSFGTLELAQRDGNAAKVLGLTRGATVLVRTAL